MPVNDYATLDQLKNALPDLGATLAAGDQDTILSYCITRASRTIDKQTYRQPGAFFVDADTTEYFQPYLSYPGCPTYQVSVYIDDMADAPTTLSVTQTGNPNDYAVWDTTQFWMYPYNALQLGQPYYRIDLNTVQGMYSYWPPYPRSVQIVGKFGYSTLPPDDITQATIIQAGRWYKRAQLAYQDKVAFMDKAPTFTYMNAIDHDFMTTISLYKRARLSTTA